MLEKHQDVDLSDSTAAPSSAGVAEKARLEALRTTGLLDSPPEEAFDRLTTLVRRLLDVPVSLVSLVDEDRQFFKSALGLPEPWATLRQTPLSHSFCQHVAASGAPLIVPNARAHPVVCDNPAIEDLNVAAYLGTPLRTPDGHVLGSLCAINEEPRPWSSEDVSILADLGAMAMTEIALRFQLQENKKVVRANQLILDNSLDVICAVDAEGRFTQVSAACEAMWGYSPGELIGRPYMDFVYEEDREHTREVAEKIRAGHATRDLENRCVRKDGRLVEVVWSAVWSAENEQLFAVARDATERRQAERALVEAKEEAEQANQLKSSLLANMSHEIRTPLTAILGFSSFLVQSITGRQREFAQRIEQGGKRLMDTLDAVLTLSQLESEGVDLSLGPVNVAQEVRHAVQLFQPEAEQKGLQLVFETHAPEAVALLDRSALMSVLSNLLSNAIKFTDQGSVSVTVGVVEEEKPKVCISVEDTGVGVDTAFQPHLFEAFRQESVGQGRSHEGTGIGLTIAQRLVERMKGHLVVKSEKSRGSRFTVFFPLASEEEAGAAAAD
ncbi:MAG: ATP-binding protein [Rhodothermales bacterium]